MLQALTTLFHVLVVVLSVVFTDKVYNIDKLYVNNHTNIDYISKPTVFVGTLNSACNFSCLTESIKSANDFEYKCARRCAPHKNTNVLCNGTTIGGFGTA